MNNISATDLRRAATIKDEIEKLQTELEAVIGDCGSIAPKKLGRPAKVGGDVSRFKAAHLGKKKRKGMSAAAKARISAAAKARWAAAKKAGKNSL